MSATNFKTQNDTYRKLIGNGLTYQIPRFQRDYSWTHEEWEDLWTDILEAVGEGGASAHYMGYLVLQSNDDKRFDVIDGQQRLTTLALVTLAVLKNLNRIIEEGINPEQNQRRLEQLRNTYVGYLDSVTLITRSKLTLNRNNNDYFQNYLVPLGALPVRGFRASENSLRKAFEWFEKKVQTYTSEKGGDKGVVLASLVENMSDKLFFTVINVTDELNAYKVFETLNARGVRLSSTDLLKNYLFSVLHRDGDSASEMNVLEQRWEGIVSRLSSESFPDFLRSHWNSRKSFVRQSDLFKAIRKKITDRALVFELLRDMESDMDTYLALTNPDISHWNPSLKQNARLLRMLRVRQPFPLLLAAQRKLSEEAFSKVLRSCLVISIRYNTIGGLHTNELERIYNQAAQKINLPVSLGTNLTLHNVIDSLQAIYPSDESFKQSFADKTIRTTDTRNNRVLRYILCELERQSSGNAHDFESDAFSIEHVFPQSPEQNWSQFTDEEAEAMTYRIGNMTLLENKANKQISNASYEVKRPILQNSNFSSTRNLADENAEWTPSRINSRQQKLAKLATAVWRIDQLS